MLLALLIAAVVVAEARLSKPGRRLIKAPKHVTPRPPLTPEARRGIFPGNDEWASGYINFPSDGTMFHFFYWMVYSRNNKATDPTIFWFTGGPGCSSVLALLAENGAWQFTNPANISSLVVNPFSWNSNANVVWIDQPVGTGYSYADKDVFERNEDEVASDVYNFTVGFYRTYPGLRSNPLYVVGESYGGHYVPAISHYIVQQNQKGGPFQIPFAGCAIGNGLVNPKLQYPQYAPLAYSYGLISHFDVEKYRIEMIPCQTAISAGLYDVAYVTCNAVVQGIQSAAGIQNVYNVKAGCPVPPLCYDFSAATTLLNEHDIKVALGVPAGLQWESCNFDVNSKFMSDWMHNMADRLLNVLAANATVLIYSGKLDYICNYLGGAAWTAGLQWPGQTQFNAAPKQPWNIKLVNGTNYKAGTSQVFKNFAWLEVENAGHMVPMDQPQAALQMINRYIRGGWRQ